jgi:hypothetical protein
LEEGEFREDMVGRCGRGFERHEDQSLKKDTG